MKRLHPISIRRGTQRGSALLIVFVFAAVVAIMLYREMPVAAFEARRQKEQTLIDRGHEYQRAVQLYYRKFSGRYPAGINMLENTNNQRFLRRRYVDPFTGKDDWRQLHAGPGGLLMDSKVQNSNQNGIFGQNGNNALRGTTASGFGTGSSASNANAGSGSSFGSGSFGSSSSSSSDSDVTVAPVAKRAPVVAAGSPTGTPSTSDLNQDPSIPLLPPTEEPATSPNAAVAASPQGATPANDNGSANQQVKTMGSGTNQAQGQPGATALGATTGRNGNLLGGAFAGVASKAKGHTIKKVNDQTDYSLWEFWYDPSKDTSMGNTGSVQNGAGGQNLQNGSQFGRPATSAFGATGSGSVVPQTTPNSPAPAPAPDSTGAAPAAPSTQPQ